MATHEYDETAPPPHPVSTAHTEIWVKQADRRMTTCPACPCPPCSLFSLLHVQLRRNCSGNHTAQGWKDSTQPHFPKTIHGYPASPSPVVLENGIQKAGWHEQDSNVLHSRHPQERGTFGWQDEPISPGLSLCSRDNVVQDDKWLPPQTLALVRWNIKLISCGGEGGTSRGQAEQKL